MFEKCASSEVGRPGFWHLWLFFFLPSSGVGDPKDPGLPGTGWKVGVPSVGGRRNPFAGLGKPGQDWRVATGRSGVLFEITFRQKASKFFFFFFSLPPCSLVGWSSGTFWKASSDLAGRRMDGSALAGECLESGMEKFRIF